MTLYYVTTGENRATLRRASSPESARRAVLLEVGTRVGVKLVREATPQDIAWVRGMGGDVPKGRGPT